MSLYHSVISLYYNYFTFKGRATRSEYWWVSFFYTICFYLLSGIDLFLEIYYLAGLFLVMTMFPLISLTVRRLHDVNRSGWWLGISIIPIINLYFLYCLLKKSLSEENAYGAYNDYKSKWVLICNLILLAVILIFAVLTY